MNPANYKALFGVYFFWTIYVRPKVMLFCGILSPLIGGVRRRCNGGKKGQ